MRFMNKKIYSLTTSVSSLRHEPTVFCWSSSHLSAPLPTRRYTLPVPSMATTRLSAMHNTY